MCLHGLETPKRKTTQRVGRFLRSNIVVTFLAGVRNLGILLQPFICSACDPGLVI